MLPELRLTDFLSLPTYFVYLSLLYTALVVALPILAKHFKRNVMTAMNLGFIIMIFGFIGARLFHVFFEDWDLYKSNPEQIIYFWSGGYVFYGGALTAVSFSYLYLNHMKESIPDWSDFFAPIGALGYGLGRVSCFLAGCCYGKTCYLPWSVKGLHPTQLYASLWELLTAVVLFALLKRNHKPGFVFLFWLCLHSIGRIIMEYFRNDFRGDFYWGISISSWISILLFSIAVTILISRSKT